MRKIFISAGHTNDPKLDRGASGNGYVEGELTVELRDLISDNLKLKGACPITDNNRSWTGKTVNSWKLLTSPSALVIDIHFNAASAVATGCEVIVDDSYTQTEWQFATEVSACIAKVLKIRNRGIKKEKETPRGNLVWFDLKGENILIEVCFISNKKDMESYQANKADLASQLADIIYKWANT